MLECPLLDTNLYSTLVLAVRDMRAAHGRDASTGEGEGTDSWLGLVLGMIVLDTLSGNSTQVKRRWVDLLSAHQVSEHDAKILYATRNAVLHGYGLPAQEKAEQCRVLLTGDTSAYAVDTDTKGLAVISVPVFCSRLVERIASAVPDDWDISEINTGLPDPRL
jgi:hypothetical protein